MSEGLRHRKGGDRSKNAAAADETVAERVDADPVGEATAAADGTGAHSHTQRQPAVSTRSSSSTGDVVHEDGAISSGGRRGNAGEAAGDSDDDEGPEQYGYEESDEEEEYDSQEGEGDGEVDGDDPFRAHLKPWNPPPLAPANETDDTMFIIAGVVGFVLCLVCAALLPSFGIETDYVMAGGMVSLLVYILYMNFCPVCGRKKTPEEAQRKLAPVETITPQMVFIVTGCVGIMIGGLIGGGLRYVKWF